jgi:hypothetical protein
MPTIVFSLPIAAGQTEAFRNAYRRFVVDRRPEFETSRRSLGVRAERGFLQQSPAGDVAIVIFEVEDPTRMFTGVASSTLPVDADFRAYLQQVFGLDVTRPPPSPPAELVFEWRAG